MKRLNRADKKQFAKELRKHTPKSELWFYRHYKPYRLKTDQTNVCFGGYIPDLINKTHKYIIEVDGSIHELARIKAKDNKKDQQYEFI